MSNILLTFSTTTSAIMSIYAPAYSALKACVTKVQLLLSTKIIFILSSCDGVYGLSKVIGAHASNGSVVRRAP